MKCPQCHAEIENGLDTCHSCGLKIARAPYSRDVVALLCVLGFCGIAGLHRFYTGRIVSGILYFLTGGWFGIGTAIDLYHIFKNSFVDSEERLVLP